MPDQVEAPPPRPYADPDATWVSAAMAEGVTDPSILVDESWTLKQKKSWVKQFHILAPEIGRRAKAHRAKQIERHGRALDIRSEPPLLRDALGGLKHGAQDLGSVGLRALDPSEDSLADHLNRQINEEEAAYELAGADDSINDTLQSTTRGVGRSLATMVPLAATGGGGAVVIGGFAASRANQAITEAKDAGLTGIDRHNYVGRAALIEGGVAGAFQAMGAGGAEKLVVGRALSQAGAKEILKQTGYELIEENLTEILDAYNQEASKVSEPLTGAQAMELLKRTSLQTIMTMGLIQGHQGIRTHKERNNLARGMADQFGWTQEQALGVIDRATTRKGGWQKNIGQEVLDEAALSPGGLANWVLENEQAARDLAALDNPSRADWERAGLPRRPKEVREEVAGQLRGLVTELGEPSSLEQRRVAEDPGEGSPEAPPAPRPDVRGMDASTQAPRGSEGLPAEGEVDMEAWDGLGGWVVENEQAAVALVLQDDLTADEFERAGLPRPTEASREASVDRIHDFLDLIEARRTDAPPPAADAAPPAADAAPPAADAPPPAAGRQRPKSKKFKGDTGALPSKGAMSVVYHGEAQEGEEGKKAQAASMNVGEMVRLLTTAGGDVPKIFPKLSRGAAGRFRGDKGIALAKGVFLGPVIVTGTAKEVDVAEVRGELVKDTLKQFPELQEGDVVVRVVREPGGSHLKRITLYRKDPQFAGKVLAHEIGHWADYMPEGSMARGNILGRLATLRGYLKSTIEASGAVGADKKAMAKLRRAARKDVGEPSAKRGTHDYAKWQGRVTARRNEMARAQGLLLKTDVEAELRALTRWWNPFNPATDEAYTKYRHSSRELYAEALSVLLNDPAALRQRAPLFYAAWHNLLERKPAVKAAYEQVVAEVVSGVAGDKLLAGIYEGQRRGEEAVRRNAESRKRDRSFGTTVGTAFVDKFWRLHRLVAAARKRGKLTADPRHVIDAAKYTGSMIEEYERRNNEVALLLEKSNLSEQDFGTYLLLARGLHGVGEGGERAIPVVGDKAGAEKAMKALREKLGDPKIAVLEKARKMFRATREELILAKLEAVGPYDKEFVQFLRDNEHYSRFEVVDYMERRLGKGHGLGMPERVGTLREVSNPWSATMTSDMALLHAVNWNHARQATVEFLRAAGPPGAVQEADTKWNGKAHVPTETGDPNLGLVTFMRDGKLEGYYVERDVARSFEKPSDAVRAVASYMRAPAHVARLWFTVLRPGFQMFNTFFRDPIRTIVNLPAGKRPLAIYKHLFASLKAAGVEEFSGKADETLVEMRKRGLLISWGNMADVDEDTTRLEMFLGKHKKKRTWREAITSPLAGWYARFLTLGSLGETANKRAAYVFLRENQEQLGWTDEQVDHAVRHWAGSPSFVTGGELTPITNNVLLFSNAAAQGWRSDIEAFRADPYGVAARRVAYAIMPKLTVIAFATGAMSALFRALGGDDDDEAVKFADAQKNILSRVSEYDLANYTVIPLGLTEDGKAVYLRLPQDETDRVISGAMVKLLSGGDVTESLQGATTYMGDQGPGWNPVATLAAEVLQYIAGGNPYDSFRERHAVPKGIREAGGKQSHKIFSKWLWNRYGGAFVYKFGSSNPAEVRSEAEDILQLPFVSDTAGRFVKITDYGLTQKVDRAREEARAKRSKRNAQFSQAVRRDVAGEPEEGDQQLLGTDERKAEKSEAALRQRASGPLGRALASSSSHEETAAILRRFAELDPRTPGLKREQRAFLGKELYRLTSPKSDGEGWDALGDVDEKEATRALRREVRRRGGSVRVRQASGGLTAYGSRLGRMLRALRAR